jgi:hypothetical protein
MSKTIVVESWVMLLSQARLCMQPVLQPDMTGNGSYKKDAFTGKAS